MSSMNALSDASIRPLSLEELDLVSGGGATVVADKGYVGIEISVGGYGVGVWVSGGNVCGEVRTPHSNKSGCA
jgi:hypothetical protein